MSTENNGNIEQESIPANLQSLGASLSKEHDSLETLEVPGFVLFMPPLIRELWTKKVYFTLNEKGELKLNGFYKGNVRLLVNQQGTIEAIDKNNVRTVIHSFEDLASINYTWWVATNNKNTYAFPERPWLEFFVEKGWADRKVIYVPLAKE